jgi:hypothetical protein
VCRRDGRGGRGDRRASKTIGSGIYGTHLLPGHARRAVHSFLYEMINKYKIDFREILQYFANAQLASFLSVLCSSRHKSEAKHFSSSITMTRLHQSYNYDDWSTRHKHYNLIPYLWFQLILTTSLCKFNLQRLIGQRLLKPT